MRHISKVAFFLPAILFFSIFSGCVISPRRGTTGGGGGGGGNGTGQIYVSDQSGNAILRFSGATAANGNISPAATITSTSLANPQYIFTDTANDRLYVANLNGGNVLVFEKVSTLNGALSPDRTINSTSLFTPTDVAVDTAKDLLYVADRQEVVVFSKASTDNGTTLAQHVIQLAFSPSAILVDAGNDRLFVADNTDNAIDVFDSASTLNGSVSANRTISGTNTQLNQPAGLRIDGAGRLIVSNGGSPGSITIFNNAASATGNIQPTATISGSNTTFSDPSQLAIDPNSNAGELYVADPNSGEIAVFSNITTTSGSVNPSPNRNVTGTNTKLSGTGSLTARGVALDLTR